MQGQGSVLKHQNKLNNWRPLCFWIPPLGLDWFRQFNVFCLQLEFYFKYEQTHGQNCWTMSVRRLFTGVSLCSAVYIAHQNCRKIVLCSDGEVDSLVKQTLKAWIYIHNLTKESYVPAATTLLLCVLGPVTFFSFLNEGKIIIKCTICP